MGSSKLFAKCQLFHYVLGEAIPKMMVTGKKLFCSIAYIHLYLYGVEPILVSGYSHVEGELI